jgi:tRNA U34 5-methylaminomethyl-2-thiouridine-forming methyltransferase MnmC
MLPYQIIETSDGSHSLYLPDLDETYHSRHGAIQESTHVFMAHGFRPILKQKNEINILEVGFGTGLNAILTLKELGGTEASVFYHSIEKHPLSLEIIQKLNYPILNQLVTPDLFNQMHKTDWQRWEPITPHFSLFKDSCDLMDINLNDWADIVYFDAFGPRVQPEMWELDHLTKVSQALRVGGVFVTYCAQGQFKRTLRDLNFKIEILPGPPGKREMTRAVKL